MSRTLRVTATAAADITEVLARSEGGRNVRVLNLREANLSLVFSVASPEKKIASRVDAATYADISGK